MGDPGDMAKTIPDDTDVVPGPATTTTGTSRWQKAVGIAGLAVVLWVGSELYDVTVFDGTFPGGGQHAPVEDQDQEGEPTPPTTGGHDPSQFGH